MVNVENEGVFGGEMGSGVQGVKVFPVLSVQFCCESKTALKKKIYQKLANVPHLPSLENVTLLTDRRSLTLCFSLLR